MSTQRDPLRPAKDALYETHQSLAQTDPDELSRDDIRENEQRLLGALSELRRLKSSSQGGDGE